MLYPLKFKKVFMEKVWGGRKFEEFLNMDLPKKINIGESWEVSAHPNGMSIVENGILKGIVTNRDLRFEPNEETLISEIMTKENYFFI